MSEEIEKRGCLSHKYLVEYWKYLIAPGVVGVVIWIFFLLNQIHDLEDQNRILNTNNANLAQQQAKLATCERDLRDAQALLLHLLESATTTNQPDTLEKE